MSWLKNYFFTQIGKVIYFEQFPQFLIIAFHTYFLNRIFLLSVYRFDPIELHVKIQEYPTHLQKFRSVLT